MRGQFSVPVIPVLVMIICSMLSATADAQKIPAGNIPAVPLPGTIFSSVPAGNLTETDIGDLLYEQDAEGFQRDMYRALAAGFPGTPVFGTMEQSADSLIRYGIRFLPGPVMLDPGIFRRSDLRLVLGTVADVPGPGLVDGFRTAAQCEDLHIAGLMITERRTRNHALQDLYGLELAVARNNLRILVGELVARNVSYFPRYLDPAVFSGIMNSPPEEVILPEQPGVSGIPPGSFPTDYVPVPASADGFAGPDTRLIRLRGLQIPANTIISGEFQRFTAFTRGGDRRTVIL